jgi:hypothetical protein
MKKIFALAALAIAASAAQAAQETNSVHFLVGMGLTGGGDKWATLHYQDGSSANITFGGLLDVHAGVEYRFANRFSLDTTIGYHFDNQSASNGSMRFERYPLEILGHYAVTDQVRLGGGMRYVMSPKVVSSGVVGGNNHDFDNTTGVVLEGEYLFSPQMGLKLRGVSESYKLTGSSTSYSGNHVGLMFNYYF